MKTEKLTPLLDLNGSIVQDGRKGTRGLRKEEDFFEETRRIDGEKGMGGNE